MKKKLLCAATVVCLLSGVLSASASPIGNQSMGRKYFLAAKDLSLWSAGLYGKGGKREVTADGMDQEMESTRFNIYVGYDFLPWMTGYVKGGQGNNDVDGTGADETSPEFGVGARFNVLHHDILDPTLFEDRILINANCEISSSGAVRNGSDQSYLELYANLTVSIVNDILGDKFYLPYSITLFLGPTYSLVETSGVNTKDDVGVIVGMEVFYTKRISFHLAGEMYGSNSAYTLAGLHICL